MPGYLRPVDPTGMSTYWAHTRRTTPSLEAGVDYYCPIGTPIRAAADGVIFETGGSIYAQTGRFVTLDLYDGRRVRYLHLSRWAAFKGNRVTRGQIIGYSGASGYGSEFFGARALPDIPSYTGGPHVHTTLWNGHYYQFGRYPLEPTLDFEEYVDQSATASGGSTPFGGFLMALSDDEQKKLLDFVTQIKSALLDGREATGMGTRAIDAIYTKVVDTNNKLSIEGQIYGRPQVIEQRVDSILALLAAGGTVPSTALANLSDDTINKLVKRLLDEQAKRLSA